MSGVMLNNDIECPHTPAHSREILEHFNWELFDHPSYSPDRTPSNYHLLTYLKNWLGSQHFNKNEEFMEGVKTWLSSQATDFFHTGIQKLIPHMTCARNPAVTTLGSILSMYVFLVYNNFFLIACFVNSSPEYFLNSPCT
jgi:hypothetical protein